MDQQAVRRFQRIRAVQTQLSFRIARQVQTARLAQRPTAVERSMDPGPLRDSALDTPPSIHPRPRATR